MPTDWSSRLSNRNSIFFVVVLLALLFAGLMLRLRDMLYALVG